ncbi:TldD/PmbA family protein [Pseudanabaena sp. FACHB-1998]|uniref:TldD/PmbA family protein n=1 Tax=Pseudanabaena sp. FACHB-1998 TaxID=2692858 RepID=UPI001680A9E1|nr:TldD/PmbA family protein [Pseudanabaena sp. FACHB-1998]MBD2179143.1 TldD/PmbA family protein [Pseudanabaena sp. FACHB-1998]
MTIAPEQLLELALTSGCEAAEVYASSSISRPVFFEANRLKQLESIDAEGVGLRIWQNGKVGLATAYGTVEPQDLVDQAIALSTLSEPEEILLQDSTVIDYPKIYGEEVSVKQMVDWGKSAIAEVLEHYPEAICGADWECSQETVRIINSKGLDCGYQDITVDGALTAEVTRGDDFLNVWYGQSERGKLEPSAIAQKVLQYLAWAKKNATAPSGKVPVIFTSKAADLLWGVVAIAMSGRQVQQKATPWLAKVGQPVIAPMFSISQNPNFGVYSAPFDDEGTPTQEFTWIDRGILQGFYGDIRTCKELGIAATGNGFRGDLGNYPSPGLFNLAIAASETIQGDILELAATLKNGLIVDQVLGDDSDLSGDFSINVDLGYRVKNGKIVGRVKDTMVSGNIYTALNQVIGVASDRHWHGSLYVPAMIVEGLSITSRG